MFEDRFYASEHQLWNTLSDEEKAQVLEHARYLTYTGSRWNNLLPVFYFFVVGPLFLVTFVLLPYLYLWESIFVVPIGAAVGAYLGTAIHQHIHAKLMRLAVCRLLEERAGQNRN